MFKNVRAWLQLLRAPNLLTVPGDPLAGFLLATYGALDWRAIAPAAASLCFYAAGLLMNDLRDLEEDRRERPSRPLPSGAVPLEDARTVCGSLGLTGVVILGIWTNLVAAGIGVALLISIGLYNSTTKTIPGLGALNMGLCRALSLALGAAAANPFFLHRAPGVWVAGSIVFAYIAGITILAGFETRERAPILARLLPALAALGGMIAVFASTGHLIIPFASAIFAVGFLAVVAETWRLLRPNPPPLPPCIGFFIRLLLVFQASFCVIYGFGWDGRIAALSLVALFPLAGMASRRFYGS